MVYVIRTRPGREIPGAHSWDRPIYLPASHTLCEMTPRALAWAQALPPDRWIGLTLRRVTPGRARQYVADGGHHETPLYVGEDRSGRRRVIYARG